MKLLTTCFSAVVLTLMMTNSYANPPAKVAMCKACHGEKGAKPIMDTYPKIAGQNKGYLAGVLKEYRAGKRSGGQAAVMSAQAKNLTDAEIDSLAEFYSKQ